MSAPNEDVAPIDARRPKHELRYSTGGWRYATGEPGENFPRGVYKEANGEWRMLAPLPYVFERLIQRSSTGAQMAVTYRMSMSPADDADDVVNVAYDDVKDGRWAQRLSVPLSGDPKIVQAVHTAILDVAHRAPERELAPRYHAGELELPPEDVAPAGYGRRAGTEENARTAWAEVLDIAARTPKLALTLGAALGGLYIRALRRKSFILLLSGDAARGKSTATLAAGGLLGDPALGAVLKSWNTTVNAVCQELGLYGMLTAFRDELGTAPGSIRREIESLVFQVTEGGNRNRGTRDGIPVMTAAWHGVFITSANESILGMVSTEGAARRVLEVPAPITNNAPEAERVEELVQSAFGWPLRWLRETGFDIDGFRDLLGKAEQEVGLPDEGVARGIAKHLALVVAGAERLEQITGTAGVRAAALSAARTQLDEQVREIREHGATADQRLWNAIQSAVAARPHAFPTRANYEKWKRGDVDATPVASSVEGWSLVGDDYPGDLAVLTDAMDRIAQTAKLNTARMALRDLERKGILVRSYFTTKGKPDSRRTHKLRVAGNWRPWVYVLQFPDGHAAVDPAATEPPAANAATPQDRDTAVTEDHVPDQQQTAPEPATAAPADDVLVLGTGGPVRYAPGGAGPCRVCGGGNPPTVDDHGPVHAMCAMGQTAPSSAPAPPAERPADEQNPVRTTSRPATPRRSAAKAASTPERAPLTLAGVLDTDGLWLPGRETAVTVDLPGDAAAAYELAAAHNLRQLWIHPGLHEALEIPATRKMSANVGPATAIEHPWATAPEGWTLDTGDGAGLAAWVNVSPPEGRRIGIVFPAYDYNRTDWHQASDGKTLLAALARFADATGEPFYMSPNETSASIVKKTVPKGENGQPALTTLWSRKELPRPVNAVRLLGDWSRVLTDEEDITGGWLHRYDINGAETSVNTSVFIGIGRPERSTLSTFTAADYKKTAGYVLANVPRQHPNLDPRLPDILTPWREVDARESTAGGPAWAPVELLILLDEIGVPIEPVEALLWPNSARLLRGFGQRVSKARTELLAAKEKGDEIASLALSVVNALRKSRIGDFNREHSRIYRPDARDMIQAKARANAYRSLRKIAAASGRYPVAFHVDAAYYVSPEHDIWTAAPQGMGISRDEQGREIYSRALGGWKPEDSLLLAKVRDHLGEKSFAAKFDKILKKG